MTIKQRCMMYTLAIIMGVVFADIKSNVENYKVHEKLGDATWGGIRTVEEILEKCCFLLALIEDFNIGDADRPRKHGIVKLWDYRYCRKKCNKDEVENFIREHNGSIAEMRLYIQEEVLDFVDKVAYKCRDEWEEKGYGEDEEPDSSCDVLDFCNYIGAGENYAYVMMHL